MSGELLHDYDGDLCANVLANVTRHLHPSTAETPSAAKCQRYAALLIESLGDGPLLDHVMRRADRSVDAVHERLLLADDELAELEFAIEDGPLDLAWQPYEHLYRRYLHSVSEVRDVVGSQAAQRWADDCERLAQRLEGGLRLSEGISTIREWVGRLRALLRAMGAVDLLPAPEGRSATATHPAPAAPAPIPQRPGDTTVSVHPQDHAPQTDAATSLVSTLAQLTDVLNRIAAPATPPTTAPEALSKEDAAKFLGVSVSAIEYMIRARKVEYVQLGAQRGRVIPVEALRKLLQANTQLTAEEELRRRRRD